MLVLFVCLFVCLVGWLVGLVGWLVSWMAFWLVGWLGGGFKFGWLVGWDGRAIVWWFAWLVGWGFVCLFAFRNSIIICLVGFNCIYIALGSKDSATQGHQIIRCIQEIGVFVHRSLCPSVHPYPLVQKFRTGGYGWTKDKFYFSPWRCCRENVNLRSPCSTSRG